MRELLGSYPLFFETVLGCVAISAGFLGSLLGIGGGFILIPFLTLALGIDIRYAVGASLVSVIATSSGAAATYVRDRFTNIRLALFLEIATTTGAITGAFLSRRIPTEGLYLLFAAILAWSGYAMARRREIQEEKDPHPSDPIADRLSLHSEYPAGAGGKTIPYRVLRVKLGFCAMYFAGCVSALLGIGSGTLKVPALDQAMRLPLKVSTATSNFMMGVTAAASAGIYFMRGDILPGVAAPIAFGVLIGSTLGSRFLGKTDTRLIRRVFVAILILVAIQMGIKGVQIFR